MRDSKQNRAPLVDALSKYIQQDFSLFHMPGHKGGREILDNWKGLIGEKALSLDLTEVEGLDDLHCPTGPIKEAQNLAASLMGGKRARFLINGVSTGLHACIMATCQEGDKVILPRHAHRSIYGAVALSRSQPVYVQPSIHPTLGIPLGVETTDLNQVIKNHQDAKALVIVHPTYHGIASDIENMIKLAKEHQIKVLVDEAHGAHFVFSPEFPLAAIHCGAHVTVQGWHKTMGSLTQSALLLLNDTSLNVNDFLRLLQSTSPSYLLTASLDAARQYWGMHGTDLAEKILELSIDFRRKIKEIKGIDPLDGELLAYSGVKSFDITKLVLTAHDLGLNGFQFARELRERYGVQVEMAEYGSITLMLTIGDTKEKITYLVNALKDLANRFPLKKQSNMRKWDMPCIPEMKMLPGEALYAPKRVVNFKDAIGKISGEFICPYPPGIPLVVPGEIISREVMESIKNIKAWGGKMQGPEDETGVTLRVIDI